MPAGSDQPVGRNADVAACDLVVGHDELQGQDVIRTFGFVNDLKNFRAIHIAPERPARSTRAGERRRFDRR